MRWEDIDHKLLKFTSLLSAVSAFLTVYLILKGVTKHES
jgi:hypothetical protein